MLFFFFGTIAFISKIFFSPPNLSVKIVKSDINYPAKINNKYLEIYNYIQDSTDNSYMKEASIELLNYLIKTQQQRIIYITNNTDKTIKSLNLRYLNVVSLTSSSVSSSYLVENEKNRFIENMSFEENSGIIYFKESTDIPQKGDLKIYLWGQFIDDLNSVSVIYDGGQAKIEYSTTVTGLKAIVAEHISSILFFLFATFIIIYYLQTRMYAVDKKNIS
jgi:hypothetical protein